MGRCAASRHGGGLSECRAPIHNNTITGNSAEQDGGGLYKCEGTIQNSIILANTASRTGPQLHRSSPPTFCCIQDWTEGGEGNINLDPQFVDEDGPDDKPNTYGDNDYHLVTGSLCIDRGKNEEWMWEALDLDGNPRVFCGLVSLTVDMGAYEHGSFHFEITSIGFTIIPFPGGTRLTWNSRPDDTYTVWSCYDLLGEWQRVSTVASKGNTTSYTLTGFMPLWVRSTFYQVRLEL